MPSGKLMIMALESIASAGIESMVGQFTSNAFS